VTPTVEAAWWTPLDDGAVRCGLCPIGCRLREGRDGPCGTRGNREGRMVALQYGRIVAAGIDPIEKKPLYHFHPGAPILSVAAPGCNLACLFCQNWDISQEDQGREVKAEELARMMLALQEEGCHNINLVTPTHVVPQILEGLVLARMEGLSVPLVYNSGGYDSVETLRLLDGIIDIYMPDAKYGSDGPAQKYSAAPGYTAVMKAALLEMHRQVGEMEMDGEDLALHGLLVRHLLLPAGAAGTEEVVRFISQEISVHTYLNVMSQYRPEYQACRYPELSRSITAREYARALQLAAAAGLVRGLAML